MFSKYPKNQQSFWATFENEFVTKNFKNHPIWSHWSSLYHQIKNIHFYLPNWIIVHSQELKDLFVRIFCFGSNHLSCWRCMMRLKRPKFKSSIIYRLAFILLFVISADIYLSRLLFLLTNSKTLLQFSNCALTYSNKII